MEDKRPLNEKLKSRTIEQAFRDKLKPENITIQEQREEKLRNITRNSR